MVTSSLQHFHTSNSETWISLAFVFDPGTSVKNVQQHFSHTTEASRPQPHEAELRKHDLLISHTLQESSSACGHYDAPKGCRFIFCEMHRQN